MRPQRNSHRDDQDKGIGTALGVAHQAHELEQRFCDRRFIDKPPATALLMSESVVGLEHA